MEQFKRGEIYWVENKLNKETGEKKSRPSLIISTPEEGDPYDDANVVFLTNNPRDDRESNVVIEKTNNGQCEGSTALCGKLFSIAGENIKMENFICRLSYDDMERVDQALARRLGLEYTLKYSQSDNETEVAEPYEYEPCQGNTEELNSDLIREIMENEIKANFYEEKYNELLNMILQRNK